MATLADLSNTETAVNAGREHVQADAREETEESLSRAEALAVKRRLEQQREYEIETVTISVSGEPIEMEAYRGVGEKTNLPRRLLEVEKAEQKARRQDDARGLEVARKQQLVVLDDMVQTLADRAVHDDIFDRTFWDGLDEEQIKDAHEQLGLKSAGGNDAGN